MLFIPLSGVTANVLAFYPKKAILKNVGKWEIFVTIPLKTAHGTFWRMKKMVI